MLADYGSGMPDDLSLIVSSGALIVSLVTLVIAIRQLRKAGEQLGEARVANELAAKALQEDIQRRNIDALAGLLEALRTFEDAAEQKSRNIRQDDLAQERGGVLLAIARASPCLPPDRQVALRAAVAQGPGSFVGAAARKSYELLLESLADTAGLDWLTTMGKDPDVDAGYILDFLMPRRDESQQPAEE